MRKSCCRADNWHHRVVEASGSWLVVAIFTVTGCGLLPADPDPEPVGLQEDGSTIVLLAPLCPGERGERVAIETVPDTRDGEIILDFAVPDPSSSEIELFLDQLPSPLPTDLVVSVQTSQVIRSSELPADGLPARSDGEVLVNGQRVSKGGFMQPRDCPTSR